MNGNDNANREITVSVVSNGVLSQQAGSMVSQRRASAVSTEHCSCGSAVDWCNGETRPTFDQQ